MMIGVTSLALADLGGGDRDADENGDAVVQSGGSRHGVVWCVGKWREGAKKQCNNSNWREADDDSCRAAEPRPPRKTQDHFTTQKQPKKDKARLTRFSLAF